MIKFMYLKTCVEYARNKHWTVYIIELMPDGLYTVREGEKPKIYKGGKNETD